MEKITKENKKNGEILIGFRKQNKMTQSELANILGRDRRDISKYEVGQRAIPQNSIDLLKKTYGLKLKSTGKVIKVRKNSKTVDIESKVITKSSVKTKEVTAHEETFRPKGNTFAKKLTSLREHLGLNQIQFAKKYKFENSRLSRLENGKTTNISVESLKALKKVVNISYLF